MAEGASAQSASHGGQASPGTSPANAGQQSNESAQQARESQQPTPKSNEAADGATPENTSFDNTEEQQESEADDFIPIRDYIRKQYADEQLDDDDAVDRRAYKHIKDLESYRERNADANNRIMALFNTHPELIGILQDMDEGADFDEALSLNLPPDRRKTLREAILSDDYTPAKDTWAAKKKEREAKYTERQQLTEAYAKNRKESAEVLRKFAEEKKMDKAQLEDFAAKADDVLKAVYSGKVDAKFLNALYAGLTAGDAIAQAAQVAEVRGRNAAISEKVGKVTPEGDGLPELSKSGDTTKPEVPEGVKMIGDLVDTFNARRTKF